MYISPEVVAHRGASAHAVEHTLAAYDLALEMGADALELDLRMSRDGALVVLHDRTLARTTGDPRAIADVALDELGGPRAPLALDAVLESYGRSCRWLLELKDPCPAMEAAVVGTIRRHGLSAAATVQSFDHAALLRVRTRAPDVAVAPLLRPWLGRNRVAMGLRRAARYAAAAGVHHRAVDALVVRTAHAAGLGLRAWTVNAPGEMERLLELGVDGLITDMPGRARSVAAAGRAVPLAA